MYKTLIQEVVLSEKSSIWKLKVPLEKKIFLWYLEKGVTVTKDNLVEKN